MESKEEVLEQIAVLNQMELDMSEDDIDKAELSKTERDKTEPDKTESGRMNGKNVRMWAFWMANGFVLTGLVLNVWYLQYILPVIGMGLFCIGLSKMRKVNGFFMAGWIMLLIRMGMKVVSLMALALPNGMLGEGRGMQWLYALFYTAFYFVIHCAWKAMFDQAGRSMKHKPYLMAAVWNVMVAGLAMTPLANSWVGFIIVLVVYIIILHQMERMENELAEMDMTDFSGIGSQDGKQKWIVIGYMLLCFGVTAGCSVAANQVKLDSREQQEKKQFEIRGKLIEMGAWEQAIMQLPDEDILLLEDTILTESFSGLLLFDPKEVQKKQGNHYMIEEEPGRHTMQAITTYFELPDNEMYIMVYFEWKDGAPYWQDGFRISGGKNPEIVDAALLFEKGGESFTASIPRLNVQEITNTGWFGMTSSSAYIMGGVKYPLGAKNQSGYIFYRPELEEDQWIASSCIDYLYVGNPIQLPYQEPEQRILNGEVEYKQHYTTFKMTALREADPDELTDE